MADGQPNGAQSTALAVSHAATPPAEISFEQMERMADSFAKSNLFGVKTKDAALSLLMIAQAEGIHPALAVMEYDIIEGKPARKAERLLARFQMSGGKVEWLMYSDEEVTAKFSHPMGSDVTVEWTIDKARKVKYYAKGQNGDRGEWKPLADKYNWRNWPRAMLRSRCIAEGVRACFPGASLVTLTSEEAQDIGEPIEARIVDRTGDADQRPAEERDPRIGKYGVIGGQAGKDVFDDLATRMSETEDAAGLEEVWAEAEKTPISQNRMDALAEHYEAVKLAHEEGLPIPAAPRFSEPPEPSPFEALKIEGEKIGSVETFKAWTSKLTPETLGKCSEDERASLKAIHAAAKARVAKSSGGAAGGSEDADAARNGDGEPGGEPAPASSPFEKLKQDCLACLKAKAPRRALATWRKEADAAAEHLSAAEQAELDTIEKNVRAELAK